MNWGTKIVLGMLTFMLFIVGMVIYMFSVHGNDALVDEDYYEKGINYNQEYNAKQNVLIDSVNPVITLTKHQIIINLHDRANYKLKLMRPSTVKDDIKIEGKTLGDRNLILIDRSTMNNGLWFLEIKWISKEKNYLFKTTINL